MEVHQVAIHISGQPILKNISAHFPTRRLSIITGTVRPTIVVIVALTSDWIHSSFSEP